MWDEMAVLSFKHLKQNDFIYVSGHLSCYTKNKLDGSCALYHEVARLTLLPTLLNFYFIFVSSIGTRDLLMKELNYVAQHGQGPGCANHEKPQSDGGTDMIMLSYFKKC